MRVSFTWLSQDYVMPQIPPAWAERVPRWYQLDPYAFILCQLFQESSSDFNDLILTSPHGSNSTDLQFVAGGASRAQKFIHTLPNIRASMALKSIGKACDFCCLQKGEETLISGLEEFYQRGLEGTKTAFTAVFRRPDDTQCLFQAFFISYDSKGHWRLTRIEKNPPILSNSDFINEMSQVKQSYYFGSLKLEKITSE